MKARLQFRNGENRYEVYFCYQPYYGGDKYGHYDDMIRDEEIPNIECKHGQVVAFLHSFYWGTTECLNYEYLRGKPTMGEVRKFIEDSIKGLKHD